MMNRRTVLLMGMATLMILSLACGLGTTQPLTTGGPSDSGQGGETPANVQAIKPVGQPEFFQSDTIIGYTFKVENPNRDVAIQDSQYSVTVSSATGTVLTTAPIGLIGTVLPGESTAVFNVVNVKHGEIAAKVDILLTPHTGVPRKVKIKVPVLSIEQTRSIPGQGEYAITGLVKNNLDKNLVYRRNSEVRVAVLVFDDAGRFIYGTNVDLDYVPARSKVAVVTHTYPVDEKPARVEMYPMLNDLDVLDDPTANENLLGVAAQNITIDPLSNGFEGGFIVENKDPTRAVLELAYQITAYDSDGVLGTTSSEHYAFLLLPGQRTGIDVYGIGGIPTGTKADRIEIQVGSGKTYKGALPDLPLETDQLVLVSGGPPDITGVIKNNSGNEFDKGVIIVTLLFDENGSILAGGSTRVDEPIPANGTTPFEIYTNPEVSPGKVAKVEAYIRYYFAELQP